MRNSIDIRLITIEETTGDQFVPHRCIQCGHGAKKESKNVHAFLVYTVIGHKKAGLDYSKSRDIVIHLCASCLQRHLARIWNTASPEHAEESADIGKDVIYDQEGIIDELRLKVAKLDADMDGAKDAYTEAVTALLEAEERETHLKQEIAEMAEFIREISGLSKGVNRTPFCKAMRHVKSFFGFGC